MQDRKSRAWKFSRVFKPADTILSQLAQLDGDNPDFYAMDIPQLKTRLTKLLYLDLSIDWSRSGQAAVTHILHPTWCPHKLPRSMHSHFSHVT